MTADPTPVIDMPIDLLGAIAAFAYQGKDFRDHLHGVYVRADALELNACDGNRLVRVDLAAPRFNGTKMERTDPSYLIPMDGIRAVVANDRVNGARRVKIRNHELGVVHFDVCNVEHVKLYTIERRKLPVDYPSVDEIMPTGRPGDAPPEIMFDPRLLADVAPIIAGLGERGFGVKIAAWSDATSPMLFASDHARFVVMPMREPTTMPRAV